MPFQYNAQFEDFQYLTAFQLQYTYTSLGKFSWRISLSQITTLVHENSHELATVDKLKQENTTCIANILFNL